MVCIIYYSHRNIIPALLAAVRHCQPDLGLTGGIGQADQWLNKHMPRSATILKLFARYDTATTVFVSSFNVSPPVVERSIYSLFRVAGNNRHELIMAQVLPAGRENIFSPGLSPARRHYSLLSQYGINWPLLWSEAATAVERVRLQIQLTQALK